jgi:hypothetical protein
MGGLGIRKYILIMDVRNINASRISNMGGVTVNKDTYNFIGKCLRSRALMP